jgi:hypothetical protein
VNKDLPNFSALGMQPQTSMFSQQDPVNLLNEDFFAGWSAYIKYPDEIIFIFQN